MKRIILISLLIPVLMFNPQNSLAQVTEKVSMTFVLSNESPGYLIDNLIANGYRDSCLFSVLVALQPISGGVISDAFLDTLAACPAKSDIFTAELWNFSDPSNNPVGIGEDGNLAVAPVYGRDCSGKAGYLTYNDTLVPVSLKLFTQAIGPEFYMDAAVRTEGGIKTFYKAFAIAWSMASTFVLTNEGGLIDDLVRAGHGNKNMVQVMQLLQPASGGILQDDFINQLAASPAGSDVLTAALSNFSHLANNPVCINSDGTMHVASIYGRDYFRTAGYRTLPENHQGYTPQLFTAAASPAKYIDAGTGSSNIPAGNSYKAFAIAWKAATTFVLSNEAPGYLIDLLIAAGYGNSSLYEVLVALKPTSGGVISDEFLDKLANCPVGSEILSPALAPLSAFGGNVYNPVCINTDGTITINAILGGDYYGKEGFETYTEEGKEWYTYAKNTEYFIDAGATGSDSRYQAFAIAWSNSTDGIPFTETYPVSPYAYPNPFTDGFYVHNLPDNTRLEIFNIHGKLLYQSKLKTSGLVQPGQLTDGVYFLKLISSQGINYQKIVKY